MNGRILLLDYARIGAAFLVIFGHLYDPSPENFVRTFIYQFHMPLFFVVSGMLHRSKPVGILARKLLWPVVVFVWFYYLICYPLYHFHLWEGATATQESAFPDFLVATFCDILGYFVQNKGLGPSWFLIALFYVKLLCWMAERIAGWCPRVAARHTAFAVTEGAAIAMLWCATLWFLGFYGESCGYGTWRNVGYLGNAAMAMPYYMAGRWAMPYLRGAVAYFSSRRLLTAACVTAAAAVVAQAVRCNGGTSMFCLLFGHQPFPYNLLWCYASGTAGTCMVLWLCTLLPRELHGFWERLTHISATSLMGVVGFQYFFCEVVRHTIGLGQPYWASAVISLVVYAICIVLWRTFQRLGLL